MNSAMVIKAFSPCRRQRIARQYEGGHEVHTVAERFAESASDYFHPTVTRIARVQNPGLADAFQNYCTSCGVFCRLPACTTCWGNRPCLWRLVVVSLGSESA